jgi:predicted transcriptional regulator
MELEEREVYFMKRRRLKIPMQEIADFLGVTQSSISRYVFGAACGKCSLIFFVYSFLTNYLNYIRTHRLIQFKCLL